MCWGGDTGRPYGHSGPREIPRIPLSLRGAVGELAARPTPSFAYVFDRCASTVWTVTNRACAISLLVRPAAASSATCLRSCVELAVGARLAAADAGELRPREVRPAGRAERAEGARRLFERAARDLPLPLRGAARGRGRAGSGPRRSAARAARRRPRSRRGRPRRSAPRSVRGQRAHGWPRRPRRGGRVTARASSSSPSSTSASTRSARDRERARARRPPRARSASRPRAGARPRPAGRRRAAPRTRARAWPRGPASGSRAPRPRPAPARAHARAASGSPRPAASSARQRL